MNVSEAEIILQSAVFVHADFGMEHFNETGEWHVFGFRTDSGTWVLYTQGESRLLMRELHMDHHSMASMIAKAKLKNFLNKFEGDFESADRIH